MPDLNPAQNDAVRRRLAEARHDGPLPADVASRLDDALVDLVAERAAGATVVPLRRRRWPTLVAAAAAVTALGLGATQYLGLDEEHPAAEKQDPGAAAVDSGLSTLLEEGGGHWNRATLASLGFSQVHRAPLVYATADSAAPEAPAHDSNRDGHSSGYAETSKNLNKLRSATVLTYCGPAEVEAGTRLFTARFAGAPVVITKAAAADEKVLVTVYDCSGDEPGLPSETFTLLPAE